MHAGIVFAVAFLSTQICRAETATKLTVSDEDIAYHSLIQKSAVRAASNKEPINIDHAHLVVHCHGCEEVKARLSVVTEQITVANAKLAECSKRRKQLEGDLVAAAKERSKAEIDLKACATERQKLAAALSECATQRSKAEKDLAQCGIDRAKLEAELKQCAEVDRPNAEKALAKCAIERKALEMQLAQLAAKLKGASSDSSIRRRRRGKRSKRSSLVQTQSHEYSPSEASHEEEDEDGEDAEDLSLLSLDDVSGQLKARHESILERLTALAKEEGVFQDALDKELKRENLATTAITEMEDKAIALLEKVENLDKEEALKTVELKRAEYKSEKAITLLDALNQLIDKTDEELAYSSEKVSMAASDVSAITAVQIETQKDLISLVQQAQDLRHDELQMAHKEHSKNISKIEALLEEKASLLKDHHEECDKLRAKVIYAKGKLNAAGAGLANCLQAKKDIQAKIDKVEKLRDDAQQALNNCLTTKARLKAQVEECHKRRDSARLKLQECLDRKQDLKTKIDACHKKRDEARKKLAECLQNKKILNAKIAKAKASITKRSSLIEVDQEASSSEEVQGEMLDIVLEIMATLREANEDFEMNAQEYMEIDKMIQNALTEITGATEEEKEIMMELQAATTDETKQQQTVSELQVALQHAFDDLTAIDANSLEAVSESKAVGTAVDQVSASLSSLLQTL